jgi:hypothetical protein
MVIRNRYALAALIVSFFGSIGLSLLVNIQLAENAREGQKRASCEIVRTQLAIYTEEPPSTPTGEAAVRAWREAWEVWKCEDIEHDAAR